MEEFMTKKYKPGCRHMTGDVNGDEKDGKQCQESTYAMMAFRCSAGCHGEGDMADLCEDHYYFWSTVDPTTLQCRMCKAPVMSFGFRLVDQGVIMS